jgi:putative alpha-1,2-mannosidase
MRYFGSGERAISILDQDFKSSEPMNYMAPADNMSAIKVNHGNQNMMHASYLFNAFGKPELTQKWARSILDRYYGYTPYDAYLGYEDQGQMSAWLNLASIGVFSIDGGIGPDSMVEFIPPSFDRIRVKRPLGADWIILATREVVDSGKAKSLTINGKEIKGFRTKLSKLLSGKKALRIEWK